MTNQMDINIKPLWTPMSLADLLRGNEAHTLQVVEALENDALAARATVSDILRHHAELFRYAVVRIEQLEAQHEAIIASLPRLARDDMEGHAVVDGVVYRLEPGPGATYTLAAVDR